MDNSTEVTQRLVEGAGTMGIPLGQATAQQLTRYLHELLRWNQKVNLTAVVDPVEVVEKHLLDSLAILPELEGRRSLLDLGAGAGLPGLPLALLRPDLSVTLVDSVSKKVGFIKHAAAMLQLRNARALHARAEGRPAREGIPLAEAVVSRALVEPEEWLPLASHYLETGGCILAMLGKAPAGLTEVEGFIRRSLRRYELPWSHAERHVAVFERRSPPNQESP